MYGGAIIIATAMMFFRIYILLFIFNKTIAAQAWPYFLILFLVSAAVGYLMYRIGERTENPETTIDMDDKTPLEFKIAVIFALLFIVFAALTQFVVSTFGSQGLTTLSLVVGVTDIDPFLLNLFQGQYNVTMAALLIATMQAMASNNILKAIYARVLGGNNTAKWVLKGFGIVLLVNIAVIVLLYIIG